MHQSSYSPPGSARERNSETLRKPERVQGKKKTLAEVFDSRERGKTLDLQGCRLSSIPKELGALSGIETINLSHNPLGLHPQEDEAFPAALGKMQSLRHLYLQGCDLRAVPAFVGGLASLAVLVLAENEKLGAAPQHRAFPTALARMKSLAVIDLEGCGLRAVPAFVTEMSSLQVLDVSKNKNLGDAPQDKAFPAALGKIKSLGDVNLHDCGLRAVPTFLGELESLQYLILSKNKHLGDAPQDKAFPAALGNMKSLGALDLQECKLRAIPAFVGELALLELLILSKNKNLGDTPLDKAFPAALGNLKFLRVLDLEDCGLRAVPALFGELASLEALDLSANGNLGDAPQDEAFPAALGKMKSLRELYLEGCGLRTLPAFIGELKSLEVLDLRGNDFELDATELAALLKGCRRLRELKLSKPAGPRAAESLASLDAFKAKLLADNPDAEVSYKHEEYSELHRQLAATRPHWVWA